MTTTNDKGVDVCGTDPLRTNQNGPHDFATDAPGGKAFQTMRARAALCGCTLHELAGGAYLVGGRGDSKAAPCLRAVGDLLRQIAGSR